MQSDNSISLKNISIEESWKEKMADEFQKEYFIQLKKFLLEEKVKGYRIFPVGLQIFNAFKYTPFSKVKVVIAGQDPYHGTGQANGLCFSVDESNQLPPSLVNIFKELHADLNLPVPKHGNLEKWAKQGVLLLNATLTVRCNEANSHKGKGWEIFTDAVIKKLSDEKSGIVFLLWGKSAGLKQTLVDKKKHFILTAAHPSPFSAHAGFFGCSHFSKVNKILEDQGKVPVDWSL